MPFLRFQEIPNQNLIRDYWSSVTRQKREETYSCSQTRYNFDNLGDVKKDLTNGADHTVHPFYRLFVSMEFHLGMWCLVWTWLSLLIHFTTARHSIFVHSCR